VITVADTGIGMGPSIRERIFQPGFTTKRGAADAGLGLATTRELVSEHSGSIEVESEPGRGSTFRVYLPSAKAAPRTRPSIRMSAPSLGPPERACRDRVVLLVDDEHAVRRALERVLRRAGYDVVAAANGREAIEAFQAAYPQPDLVVLDVDMPVMDGEATQRGLREHDPALPVLVLTGHANDERTRRMLAAGASGCLHKPVDVAELLGWVARLSDQRPSLPPEAMSTKPHDRSKLPSRERGPRAT
jgi:two-component system, cell cycle sensor histidine kinase and response regulator CckA